MSELHDAIIVNKNTDIVQRLCTRAAIRRQIPSRRSVQEGQPDRLADLLEEAAAVIENLQERLDGADISCGVISKKTSL
jgi:hypothetical protein